MLRPLSPLYHKPPRQKLKVLKVRLQKWLDNLCYRHVVILTSVILPISRSITFVLIQALNQTDEDRELVILYIIFFLTVWFKENHDHHDDDE